MMFNCYQCDDWAYLFADSRCAACTRVNPDTGGLDKENDDDMDSAGFGDDDTHELQAQGQRLRLTKLDSVSGVVY